MRRRGNAAQWVLVYTIQVKIKMHGLLCIDDLMYRQQVSKVYILCIPEYQTFERAEREGFKEPAIASAIASQPRKKNTPLFTIARYLKPWFTYML